jgi:hypothetical protein
MTINPRESCARVPVPDLVGNGILSNGRWSKTGKPWFRWGHLGHFLRPYASNADAPLAHNLGIRSKVRCDATTI